MSIVNTSRSSAAFGRYAGDLCLSLSGHADVFSFIVMGKDADSEFPGKTCGGFRIPLPRNSTAGNYLNSYFNGTLFSAAFRKGLKEVLATREAGAVIHYASQEVFPFHDDGSDVVTVHDLFALNEDFGSGDFASRQYRKLVMKNLEKFRHFNRVIAVSKFVGNELVRNGFSGRIDVIYSPVSVNFHPLGDRKAARRLLQLPDDKKLVLSVSTAHKRKNLKTVAETMDVLGSGYRLVRVGERVGDSITFERISDELLNLVYNACDVLLFPSLGEGYGYPVVEAFSTGLPVVASDIEVMREVAGDAALLTEPNPESCARAVREAAASEELASKGLARSATYSFDSFSARMVEYYGFGRGAVGQTSGAVSLE